MPILHRSTNLLLLTLSFIALTAIAWWVWRCSSAEEEALFEERAKPDLNMGLGLRMVFLFISIDGVFFELPRALFSPNGIFVFKLVRESFDFYVLAVSYFVAVDPLPPGKSKVKEWAENIAAAFKKLAPLRVSH